MDQKINLKDLCSQGEAHRPHPQGQGHGQHLLRGGNNPVTNISQIDCKPFSMRLESFSNTNNLNYLVTI